MAHIMRIPARDGRAFKFYELVKAALVRQGGRGEGGGVAGPLHVCLCTPDTLLRSLSC